MSTESVSLIKIVACDPARTNALFFVPGKSYSGDYFEDKRHGVGRATWPDGSSYDGQWKVGKRHGKGQFTDSSGKTVASEWKLGKRIA